MRTDNKQAWRVICAALAMFAAGCGTTGISSDPKTSAADLVFISGETVMRTQNFIIVSWAVPHEWVLLDAGCGWRHSVQVPPGTNNIAAWYRDEYQDGLRGGDPYGVIAIINVLDKALSKRDPKPDTDIFLLNAEAGHKYIVRFDVRDWFNHGAVMWIEDAATGAVVAGTKPPLPPGEKK